MKIFIKALLMFLSAAAVFAASLFGTVAYFTAGADVSIDFSVGKVYVSAADPYSLSTMSLRGGSVPTKVVPGTPIGIEPMVTIGKGSESSYVRVLVTFKGVSELDRLYGPFTADKLFNTHISGEWTNSLLREDPEADTRTFEFRYYAPVDARDEDKILPAPFTNMTFSGDALADDDRDEISAMFAELSINIVSQAIQTEGFTDADEAWASYPEE
ncbi:MAG: hypothetical protein E7672_02575 [Ruminococcaceae bacterium]|nr:hypothetical protein [Oscillospiraceae bacterium]